MTGVDSKKMRASTDNEAYYKYTQCQKWQNKYNTIFQEFKNASWNMKILLITSCCYQYSKNPNCCMHDKNLS